MNKFVIGVLVGFLVAASAALALDVSFPAKSKAQARVIVDELGNVLFGAVPAKVEVTNLGEISNPTYQVVDATGAVVGEVFPPGADPLHGDPFSLSRETTNGLQYLVTATPFELDTVQGAHGLYYVQPGCAGQPLIKTGPDFFVTAVGTTAGLGGGIFRVPLDAGAITNFQSGSDIPSGVCATLNGGGSERLTANYATVDLSSLAPPYRFVKQ